MQVSSEWHRNSEPGRGRRGAREHLKASEPGLRVSRKHFQAWFGAPCPDGSGSRRFGSRDPNFLRHPYQGGQGLRRHLSHQLATMDLDRGFTGPDLSGNLFIEPAPNDQGKNLSLPGCQRFKAVSQNNNFRLSLSPFTISLQCDLNRIQQILIAERLFEKPDGSRLHGSHGHRNIAVGSDEDNWNRDVG